MRWPIWYGIFPKKSIKNHLKLVFIHVIMNKVKHLMKYFDNTNIIKIAMFKKSKISNPFKVEIFLLHRNMQLEVVKVIKPFFGVF
jgi:hypothetical protein